MIVFGVCSSFSIQPLNQNAIFYHCQNVIDKEINWSEYDLWSRPHPLNLCEKKDNKCRKVFGKENKYTVYFCSGIRKDCSGNYLRWLLWRLLGVLQMLEVVCQTTLQFIYISKRIWQFLKLGLFFWFLPLSYHGLKKYLKMEEKRK